MKRLVLKFVFIFFIVAAFYGKDIAKTGSQITKEYISGISAEARKKFNVPAIAIAVMDSKSIFIVDVQGTRIWGTDNPVSAKNYFHIGSCSKLILGLIAGKLVDSGVISWETPFLELYPELVDFTRSEYKNISFEDLFLCEAGIMPYTSGDEILPDVNNNRYEFIKFLIQQKPASKIKSNGKFEHLYSNASYVMASAMIEKVTGKTYEELIKQYVIDELKLNVYLGWPNTYSKDETWGHTISGIKVECLPPEDEYRIPYLIVPAGDISMKPEDFAKLIQLNLQGLMGNDNFVSSKMYKFIHFGHDGFSIGVANGDLREYKFSGMDGSGGTFFCRSIIVPDSDFAFTIMTNACTEDDDMKAVEWLTSKIIKKYYK